MSLYGEEWGNQVDGCVGSALGVMHTTFGSVQLFHPLLHAGLAQALSAPLFVFRVLHSSKPFSVAALAACCRRQAHETV